MLGGCEWDYLINVLLIILIIVLIWKLFANRENFIAQGKEIGPKELRQSLYPQ